MKELTQIELEIIVKKVADKKLKASNEFGSSGNKKQKYNETIRVINEYGKDLISFLDEYNEFNEKNCEEEQYEYIDTLNAILRNTYLLVDHTNFSEIIESLRKHLKYLKYLEELGYKYYE